MSDDGSERNNQCLFCLHTLSSSKALTCPECGNTQTLIHVWSKKHSIVLGSMKFILGALLVPLSLWFVATWYSNQNRQQAIATQKHKEVTEAVADLSSSAAMLYDPYVIAGTDECVKRVDSAYESYVKASIKFLLAVERHYPELVPTTVLMRSLDGDIAYELLVIWGGYVNCMETSGDFDACTKDRRRYSITSIASSQLIIEFLCCKSEELASEDSQIQPSEYCRSLINSRNNLLLKEPTRILSSFNGNKIPLGMTELSKSIFDKLILPGSGLMEDNAQ